MMSLAIFSASLNAQTLSVDAESGNRAIEQANCWGFGATSYTSTAAQVINGKWSIRSNQPTNLEPGSCWVKSPWLKPNSGNITLNIKFESASAATTRRIIAGYITYDAAANVWAEGSYVRFDSTTYGLPLPTTSQAISYKVPSSIANSGLPFKIQLSFVGTGGTTRFNIDDISIPGTYFADPANSCLPIVVKADADGDGVVDAEDAYPNDATRAYNTSIPGRSQGTLLFEDAWPQNGDYDFNDLVLGYGYTVVTNAKNKVVELKGQAIIKAIGASYKNGFGIQLDKLSPSLITSVSGVKTDAPAWLSVNANGTEAGQTFANVVVIDNVSRLMPSAAGFTFVNTVPGEVFQKPDTTNFVINFEADKVSLSDIVLNPYLIINQDRTLEVHLADKAPTDKANNKNFATFDDDSNVGASRFYKNKNNLPWALDVPASIPYSIEQKSITDAYLNLSKWAGSNGVSYTDWYIDLTGYRNSNNIYTK